VSVQALILAAGLGTRLAPLTLFRAKPAVPFLNRPIINYALDSVRQAGASQVFINLHHLPETVLTAVGDASDVLFSFEPAVLGTAGAIGKLRKWLGNEPIVLCNGKIYFEQDLDEVLHFHHERGNWVTMVVVPYREHQPFTPVSADEEGNIVGFGLKGSPVTKSRYIFTGVHILSPDVLNQIPEGPSDTVRDIYPRLMAQNKPVRVFVSQASWSEISTPGRFLGESLRVLTSREISVLSHDSTDVLGKQVVIGKQVEIGADCRLENSIIWDNVVIGSNVRLHGCVISSSTRLPSSSEFRDMIITPVPPVSDREIENRGGRRQGDIVLWPVK